MPSAKGHVLLSREAFKTQVFARSKQRCVFCGAPAVDAHHILERKLFDDGGYYLDNGAAVCEDDHWKCETTEHGLDDVRRACGIETPAVPVSMQGLHLDKWGNRVWPSGMRTWGPLAEDTGARKALAQGGFLGFMMPTGYAEDVDFST